MSNNLDLTQVATNQANPEVPVNDKGGELDAALTETLTVDLTNSASVSAANYRRCVRINVTTTGVAKTLTLPAVKRLLYIANNGTEDISVAKGSTTLAIAFGEGAFVYTDGTANGLEQLSSGGGAGSGPSPFDMGVFAPGLPGAGATVLRFKAVRVFDWPINLTGSLFSAGVASTGTATFALKNNGGSIGSVAFTSSAAGVATFASGVSFAIGDVLEITAPGSQDATLADVALNFLGSRP